MQADKRAEVRRMAYWLGAFALFIGFWVLVVEHAAAPVEPVWHVLGVVVFSVTGFFCSRFWQASCARRASGMTRRRY